MKQARIVGYADRLGDNAYNEKLSMNRADSVRKQLQQNGVVTAQKTEVRWLGETVPVTNCPDSLGRTELIECLQKDRRVEVEVDYLPVAPQYPAQAQYPVQSQVPVQVQMPAQMQAPAQMQYPAQ